MYKTYFLPITKNKSIEIEFDGTNNHYFFDLSFSFTRKTDHAGFYFILTIFKYCLRLSIYDNRHWNWEENRWYKPGEEYNEWLKELEDLDNRFANLQLEKCDNGDDEIHKFYLKQFQKLKSDLDLYKEILNDIKNKTK